MLNTTTNINLDKAYWNRRWERGETGWNIGYASPAIVEYMAQLTDKNIAVLIPGCGNAYEAEKLVELGFTNITIMDIAPALANKLKQKFSANTAIKVVCDNFFEHNAKYDVIIEQTFFCALLPSLRSQYAVKCAELLNANGKIVGVLFNKAFEQEGPPFGGCKEEYRTYFTPYFTIKKMELCYNSIAPRINTELFFNLIKN